MEWDIWVIVRALVTPLHTVIEFGARFGTSSCVLADATANSGRVVSVEVDASVYEHLMHNREQHRCNFHVVQGSVASTRLVRAGHGKLHSGYAFTMKSVDHSNRSSTVPNLRFTEVEDATKLRFDVAVVDCEACIGDVLGDGSGGVGTLVDQLDLIILELDGDHTAAHAQLYSSWTAKLLSRGFHRIWASQDTMDVYAQWSQQLYYHVWQRAVPLAGASHLPRYNRSSCSETRRRMNYTTAEIRCATSRGF